MLDDFLFLEDGLSASLDLDLRFLLFFFFFFFFESESEESVEVDDPEVSEVVLEFDEMLITSSVPCPRLLLSSFLNRLSCKLHYN